MQFTQRDLAQEDLWQRSLERSRRRRELAPFIRKTVARRRRISLAVSAAVATAPTAPAFALTGGSRKQGSNPATPSALERHGDPVLLYAGVTSASVKQLQHALGISEDGMFGPVTEAAVKRFQKRHHLPVTGKVDVHTWLELFPNDMIISTPNGWGAQTDAAAASADGSAAPLVDAAGGAQGATVPAVNFTPTGPATPAAGNGGAAGGLHAASVGTAQWGLPGAAAQGESWGAPTADSAAPVSSGDGGSQAGLPSGGGSSGAAPSVGTPAYSGPSYQVPVPKAPSGSTQASLIAKMIWEANWITKQHYAYLWGGGHNDGFTGPYDCSGAVSAVLHAAGLLKAPMVSGDFDNWGAPGPGAVTIYSNASHVYMSILGHFFGTSGQNPGGGAAWYHGAPMAGFVVTHVPFEKMHLRLATRVRSANSASHVRSAKRTTSKRRRSGGSVHSANNTPRQSGSSSSQVATSGNGGTSAGQDQYVADQSTATNGDSSQQPTYSQAVATAPPTAASAQPGPPPAAPVGGSAPVAPAPSAGSEQASSVNQGPAPASQPAPAAAEPTTSAQSAVDAQPTATQPAPGGSQAAPAGSAPVHDAAVPNAPAQNAAPAGSASQPASVDEAAPAASAPAPQHAATPASGEQSAPAVTHSDTASADSSAKQPAAPAGGSAHGGGQSESAGLNH